LPATGIGAVRISPVIGFWTFSFVTGAAPGGPDAERATHEHGEHGDD